jgi:hypothetical protein
VSDLSELFEQLAMGRCCSRPTAYRSTPIMTRRPLPFTVRLDSEGAMEARLIA